MDRACFRDAAPATQARGHAQHVGAPLLSTQSRGEAARVKRSPGLTRVPQRSCGERHHAAKGPIAYARLHCVRSTCKKKQNTFREIHLPQRNGVSCLGDPSQQGLQSSETRGSRTPPPPVAPAYAARGVRGLASSARAQVHGHRHCEKHGARLKGEGDVHAGEGPTSGGHPGAGGARGPRGAPGGRRLHPREDLWTDSKG